MGPIEGARPSTGSSLASARLSPQAAQTPQVPGRHSGSLWPCPSLARSDTSVACSAEEPDGVARLRRACDCRFLGPNAAHAWGLRGCSGRSPGPTCSASPARLSPFDAPPWHECPGFPHPLAFERSSNPGNTGLGKWEERPDRGAPARSF